MTVHRTRTPRALRAPRSGGRTAVAVAVGVGAALSRAAASAEPVDRGDIDWHRRVVASHPDATALSPTRAADRTMREAPDRWSAGAYTALPVREGIGRTGGGAGAATWQKLFSARTVP
ncbi:MAG TPA: hypothetical protein VFY17_00670 [Pilimelia sp.]|nr:hypothetical protein [Pilimelia sp.]